MPSFRPQTGRGAGAADKDEKQFFAKEYSYSRDQLLALRPRTNAQGVP
jgi:hypothetical protein